MPCAPRASPAARAQRAHARWTRLAPACCRRGARAAAPQSVRARAPMRAARRGVTRASRRVALRSPGALTLLLHRRSARCVVPRHRLLLAGEVGRLGCRVRRGGGRRVTAPSLMLCALTVRLTALHSRRNPTAGLPEPERPARSAAEPEAEPEQAGAGYGPAAGYDTQIIFGSKLLYCGDASMGSDVSKHVRLDALVHHFAFSAGRLVVRMPFDLLRRPGSDDDDWLVIREVRACWGPNNFSRHRVLARGNI
jgi:hypothetical protein